MAYDRWFDNVLAIWTAFNGEMSNDVTVSYTDSSSFMFVVNQSLSDDPTNHIIFQIASSGTSSSPILVEWGDGTSEYIREDSTRKNMEHVYSDPGVDHTVSVHTATCPVYFGKNSNILKQVLTPLPSGYNGFSMQFLNCVNLTSVCDGLLGRNRDVTSIQYLFYNCPLLQAIPNDLLSGLTKVRYLNQAFTGCESLSSIPDGLFDDIPVVFGSADYLFSYCTSITSLYEGIFDHFTEVTSFNRCFLGCTSLTDIPSNLFSNCENVTSFEGCFWGCTSLRSVPSGIFGGTYSTVDYTRCFYSCSSLSSIPPNLFSSSGPESIFAEVFQYCTSLKTIPSSLFNGIGSDFYQAFLSSGITEVPSNLFKDCTHATRFTNVFWGCPIEKIGDSVFENCYNATGFGGAFTSSIENTLVEIGNRVFYGCSSANHNRDINYGGFSQMFSYCKKLKTVGESMFRGCSSETDFSEIFSRCTALERIGNSTFEGCTKATDFTRTFEDCTHLESTGDTDRTFFDCPNVTSFRETFYNCARLLYAEPIWITHSLAAHNSCFEWCTRASNYDVIPNDWKGVYG